MAITKTVKRTEVRIDFDGAGKVTDAWARRVIGVSEDGAEIAEAQKQVPLDIELIQASLGSDPAQTFKRRQA